MGNEHDGLVVLGEIPTAAVEEASRLSGLQNAKLVEKPFSAPAHLKLVSHEATCSVNGGVN